MTLMEFSMYPVDKGESLSQYVAGIIDVVEQSGLPYQLGSMGTVVEGEWNDLIALLSRCHQVLEPISNRIVANVKFDTRKNSTHPMEGKVRSVQQKMKRNQ